MNHFIHNLRTYIQIIQNRFAFNFETIEINNVLSKISNKKTFQPSNSSKPLFQFELYQEDDLPKIYADENRLTQIIELVLTSAKLDNSTQTELTISQVDTVIKFVISSEKMFISSYSTGFYFDGSPFGEYIIPHIIEAHKGTIQIETSHETGSTFSFTIPIADKREDL